MSQFRRRNLLVAAGGALLVSFAGRARAASPEALRGQAVKLMEKARSPGGDLLRDSELARKKVEEAIAIVEGRSTRSGRDEDLLIELRSLLYWIRKMTPLSLALKPQPIPKPPPPSPGGRPYTPPPQPAAPPPPPPPPPPPGVS